MLSTQNHTLAQIPVQQSPASLETQPTFVESVYKSHQNWPKFQVCNKIQIQKSFLATNYSLF